MRTQFGGIQSERIRAKRECANVLRDCLSELVSDQLAGKAQRLGFDDIGSLSCPFFGKRASLARFLACSLAPFVFPTRGANVKVSKVVVSPTFIVVRRPSPRRPGG